MERKTIEMTDVERRIIEMIDANTRELKNMMFRRDLVLMILLVMFLLVMALT